jgi:hypothetical protein
MESPTHPRTTVTLYQQDHYPMEGYPMKGFGKDGAESRPAREIYWHNSFLDNNLRHSWHKNSCLAISHCRASSYVATTHGRRIPSRATDEVGRQAVWRMRDKAAALRKASLARSGNWLEVVQKSKRFGGAFPNPRLAPADPSPVRAAAGLLDWRCSFWDVRSGKPAA